MRTLLVLVFTFWASVLTAGDLLSESQGHWEGEGVLASGMTWPIYVHFKPNSADVVTPDDGCEAVWTYSRLGSGLIEGWEEVTVGMDRCYVGLKFAVTQYDESRLEVNWFKPSGVFIAEALLWRVQ